MALGADKGSVVGAVVVRSMALATAGIVVGTVVALGVTRAIESMLFGVSTTDGATYGGTLLLVLLVSVVAAGVPALRAARISPASALSAE
jgi:ABC-type antimicrobial peptide transport system permease subunit